MTSTKDDIETLAGIVAREAAENNVDLAARVEALKELNRFYDILCKQKGVNIDTPPVSGASFEQFREAVKDPPAKAGKATNGAVQVRDR